jgi:hypothetical protein
MEDGGDLADLGDQCGEFFGEDRLHAVGEGFFGFVVNFDEEAIGANSDSGARKRKNLVALAGAVRRVDEDREMAAFLDGGNHGEIEGIAGEVGEGTDAAFAEHDVVVAFGEDIFGGHEKFVEGSGHAALEENRLFGASGTFEEREVLHVAGADLDDVGVFLNEVQGFVVDGFGNDAESELLADLGENLEAGEAEPLEGVRRGTRLVGASAEEAHTGGFQAFGDGEALLLGLDGTGAGDESDVGASGEDVARGSGDADDGVFFLDVARDEFVRFGDGNAFDDTGHGFENAKVDGAVVASDSDGGASGTGDGVSFEAEGFDAVADSADLCIGGVGLHDDEHSGNP